MEEKEFDEWFEKAAGGNESLRPLLRECWAKASELAALKSARERLAERKSALDSLERAAGAWKNF